MALNPTEVLGSFKLPEKRSKLLRVLVRMQGLNVFFQETHFKRFRIPCLINRCFPTVYHCTALQSKVKEVSVRFLGLLFLNTWMNRAVPC